MTDSLVSRGLGDQMGLSESNPYKVLGLDFEATEDDIRKAYKQLSLQLHPDKNPNGTEQFQELSNAYELLLDSEFRAKYISAVNKVQNMRSGLETYSCQPEPRAFIQVYTAVFDIQQCRMTNRMDLQQILHSQVSASVRRLADCLRQAPHEPYRSWVEHTISEMYQVRNHLYCLQGGFAYLERIELPAMFESTLNDARQEVGIYKLSNNFWCNIAKVVAHDIDSAAVLPDLNRIWYQCCGCPIVGLRVTASPTDRRDRRQQFYAMQAAFPAFNANLLSPSLLNCTSPVTCIFHIRNKPLIAMVAMFLSDDDLQAVFRLHRWSARLRGYKHARESLRLSDGSSSSHPSLSSTLFKSLVLLIGGCALGMPFAILHV